MSKAPIVRAIIGTRTEQVASFSEPQEDIEKLGWMIRKKPRMFIEEKKLEKEDQYKIEALSNFMLDAGVNSNAWNLDNFDTFLRKITPDSLTIDQMTFEIVRNRKGMPTEYFATDGATYRLARSIVGDQQKEEQIRIKGYFPAYVQVYQQTIQNEFYPWELCFGMRNHSTNIYNNGYGNSELEDMIRIVTWMLYGDTYNGQFFSTGSAPKGIMLIKGAVNEARLAEFRQEWKAQVAGVQNAWKTPMLEGEDMQWVDLQKGNRDMEFSRWQEYLIKLSCAIYKMDPTEIGFSFPGSQQGGVTYETSKKDQLKYSREKGLHPLLKFIQRKINKYIITPLDPKFEFIFTGMEEDTNLDNDIKMVSSFMGLKEVRRRRNLPDKIDKDDIILNPAYLQNIQMKMAGAEQSNGAVDEMTGETQGNPYLDENNPYLNGEEDNPYHLDEETSGAIKETTNNPFEEDNPMLKAFNQFTKEYIEK